jgi:transcriptional regulator with XRE-family HTH domain
MTNERLRSLRKKKGYTQIKIQLDTGIDQSDYSKIETGIRYPTVEQAKRLALLLDTSTDYIFGLTDAEDPYPRSNPRSK